LAVQDAVWRADARCRSHSSRSGCDSKRCFLSCIKQDKIVSQRHSFFEAPAGIRLAHVPPHTPSTLKSDGFPSPSILFGGCPKPSLSLLRLPFARYVSALTFRRDKPSCVDRVVVLILAPHSRSPGDCNDLVLEQVMQCRKAVATLFFAFAKDSPSMAAQFFLLSPGKFFVISPRGACFSVRGGATYWCFTNDRSLLRERGPTYLRLRTTLERLDHSRPARMRRVGDEW